jgi:hypothetical protein
MNKPAFYCIAFLTIAGCSSHDVEASDEGRVCLFATDPSQSDVGGPQSYPENASLFVEVTLDACLSACIQNEIASCDVRRDGDRLIVHSDFAYDKPSPDQACVAVCHALEAVCESPALEAGTYQVTHGGDSYPLVVPSSGAEPCL